MTKSNRMPKADYFRMRLQNAIDNGLTRKAEYYRSRLQEMGEPLSERVGSRGVTQHDFGNGLTIYSF